MELAVADVDRDHATRTRLEQAVGEAARRGADIRAVAPFDLDGERCQCGGELLASARDERRGPLDAQLHLVVDLLPGLVVARHEPGENERLGLAPALGQALLHEEDVEPLRVRFNGSARELEVPGGEHMPTWLLVLIIVLVVLALFGGFGYSRR